MSEVAAGTVHYDGNWPHLNDLQSALVIAIPILGFIACVIWLRCIWPEQLEKPVHPSTYKKKKNDGDLENVATVTTQLNSDKKAQYSGKTLEAGDARGDYKKYNWTKEFDATFLGFMIISLAGLSIVTSIFMPELWSNGQFWLLQLPKLGVMMGVSLLGGMMCRYMCIVDDEGYIQTKQGAIDYCNTWNLEHPGETKKIPPACYLDSNGLCVKDPHAKKGWFKVNYTRKFQHFAAYAVPLWVKSNVTGTLALCWGDWFTMLGFLVQIKPIRERFTFFMLQFNSLDRPEDRPKTIEWIIGGNILPGLFCIVFFRYLYAFTGQTEMAMIWIFVTGVGDGLAEPVGVTWGIHKYYSTSLFGADHDENGQELYYMRSYEGSACVFISGLVFTAFYYDAFANATQFWVCMIILPPLLAWAEAIAPHTQDTPFLMILGGLTCLGCSYIPSFL